MKLKEFGPPGGMRAPLRSATGNGVSVNAAFITAHKVCEGYVFTGVCPHWGGGMCGFIPGGHAWFYVGVCMVLFGGMRGFIWGGMRGFIQGGVCGFSGGGHVWFFHFFRIQ